MKQIFTLIIALGLTLGAFAQNVGETPPDFSLNDLAEMKYILSENKGKVIMVFLVGFNCPSCLASARDVKSEITDVYANNDNFQAVVIDVWDGNKSSVQGFKSSTGLDATFLQKGSGVASSWSTVYDRLFVIGSEGKVVFQGTKNAKSEVSNVKSAIQSALNNVVTSAPLLSDNTGFELSQNYPNPMLNETKISFRIGKASQLNFSIFDITGKMVVAPIRNFYENGEHEIVFQRNDMKSGVYFYRLQADNFEAVKRMVVQ